MAHGHPSPRPRLRVEPAFPGPSRCCFSPRGAGMAPRVAPALPRPRSSPGRLRLPGRARRGGRQQGCKDAAAYWAVDVSEGEEGPRIDGGSGDGGWVGVCGFEDAHGGHGLERQGRHGGPRHRRSCSCIAGMAQYGKICGACGAKAVPTEAGRRKQCSNESCKKRIYPRVDPVVIMLVIDKENDRALLSRQSRFVPRMWSCLAGFLQPGESLEEAVRRETWEETGIEVGQVIYHSSQPWPVGPNSMPCQLMVGSMTSMFVPQSNMQGCWERAKPLDDLNVRPNVRPWAFGHCSSPYLIMGFRGSTKAAKLLLISMDPYNRAPIVRIR